MKIAILTLHNGINHGGLLQVRSLSQFLELNGHEISVINYKSLHYTLKEFASLFYKKGIRGSITNIQKKIYFILATETLNLTRRYFCPKFIDYSEYDLMIYGSDEIWNYKSPFVGYDLTYFGKGVANRKITYATSFGNTSPNELPSEIKELIEGYEQILYRDLNSENVLSVNKIEDNIEFVCDPVFLVDDKLDDLEIDDNVNEVIIIYCVNISIDEIDFIKNLGRKLRKKIISIGYYNQFADKNYVNINVDCWIKYIADSDIFITNTFHGSMYAIKYSKSFYLIKKSYWNNKIEGLMRYLHIDIESESNIVNLTNLDYQSISKNMENLINKSKKTLLEVITDENSL